MVLKIKCNFGGSSAENVMMALLFLLISIVIIFIVFGYHDLAWYALIISLILASIIFIHSINTKLTLYL